MEFDIKTDDYTTIDGILYFRAEGGGENGVNQGLLDIKDNNLIPFRDGKYTPFPIMGEWVHVAIEFDYTDEELLAEWKFNVTMTFTQGERKLVQSKIAEAKTPGFVGLDFLRFGVGSNQPANNYGMSYRLDNMRAFELYKLYALPTEVETEPVLDGETGDTNGDGRIDHELGEYSIEYLQYLLYKNGVHMGYLASTGQPNPWPRPDRIGSDVYSYTTMENNWNSVCTGGMWMGALMLLETEQYKDEAAELLAINIDTIAQYGLDQYAPDGSYVESPGYWGYGTNYLLHGMMALWRSAGTDYGILERSAFQYLLRIFRS